MSRRAALVVTGLVLGLGSFGAVAALVAPGKDLTLFDAATVIGVLVAGGGHVCLAVLAALGRRKWPLRHGEASTILRLVGWFAIVMGLIGAAPALDVAPGTRGVEGIVVSGVFEFLVRTVLFTVSGWTLLGLRLVTFQSRNDPNVSKPVGSVEGESAEPQRSPFAVEAFGNFSRDQIEQTRCPDPRPTTPAIEVAIERAWNVQREEAERIGRTLHNGELVRLVQAELAPTCLRLRLGTTCYRDFVGTNFFNAESVYAENPAGFADPLGISATVITGDGFLALGRRSDRVAFHAGYLHPFGGMLETSDRLPDSRIGDYDIFGSMIRELHEEVALEPSEIGLITLRGLVRDRAIHQPELLFDVPITLTRAAFVERFMAARDAEEHVRIEFIHDDPEALLQFLLHPDRVTPVAQAALLLHGRHDWGETWYEQTCYVLYGELPPRDVTAR